MLIIDELGYVPFSKEGAEKEMSQIEERMKGEPAIPLINEASGKIPVGVRQRIEKLFREAQRNRDRAYTLKRELDKWDLFQLYEDRFLDLFKQHL